MPNRPLSAIVLAAGEGTRMRSSLPKPLHRLCGRPMVLHVLDALAELSVERVVVVVGARAVEVTKVIGAEAPAHLALEFVDQTEPRGTGDAAAVALTAFPEGADLAAGDLVVLPGDAPLVRPATLAALVRAHRSCDAAATLLTARLEDPTGYGRIVRTKDGRVARIVEEVDASEDERAIDEVATSIYCFKHAVLAPALRRLSPDNAKGEYYLTDTIAVLHDAGYPVVTQVAPDPIEAAGVNDRAQLAAAEAEVRARINERWMRRGVTMVDPEATYLDTTVELAADVTVLPGAVLEGRTVVGEGAVVGVGCHLVDCEVGAGARLEHVVARQAVIGEGARVGPFVHLEPGTRVLAGRVVGPGTPIEGASDRAEEREERRWS
ncbi:MAG TPA: NTP transferase domain-containing protein [Acidimicrobiales bacterium]|nr:NTP transferase domain-containing protein [Acidimicrobiales bacterium]